MALKQTPDHRTVMITQAEHERLLTLEARLLELENTTLTNVTKTGMFESRTDSTFIDSVLTGISYMLDHPEVYSEQLHAIERIGTYYKNTANGFYTRSGYNRKR